MLAEEEEEEEEEDTAPVIAPIQVCLKISIYIRTGIVSGVQSFGHHRSGWQQGAISSPSSTSSAEEQAAEAEEEEEEEEEPLAEQVTIPEAKVQSRPFPITNHRMSPPSLKPISASTISARFRPEVDRIRIRGWIAANVRVIPLSGLRSRRPSSLCKVNSLIPFPSGRLKPLN